MLHSIVCIAEAFSVLSLRSSNGQHFFPRIFFLLFCLFHFYLFSFPFGFTHAALVCTAFFMIHSMVFFWHRYELPAVALGRVTPAQPRMRPSTSPPSPVTTVAAPLWPPVTDIPPLHGEPGTTPLGTTIPHHTALDPTHVSRYHPIAVPNGEPRISPPASHGSLSTLSGQQQHRRHSLRSSSSHGGSVSHAVNSATNPMISRQTSSSALYWGGDEDGDDASFLFFMDGEVVMPRRRASLPNQHHQQQHYPPTTPNHQSRIPDHVLAAGDVVATPVRENLSSRSPPVLGPEHPLSRTAPTIPDVVPRRHPHHRHPT